MSCVIFVLPWGQGQLLLVCHHPALPQRLPPALPPLLPQAMRLPWSIPSLWAGVSAPTSWGFSSQGLVARCHPKMASSAEGGDPLLGQPEVGAALGDSQALQMPLARLNPPQGWLPVPALAPTQHKQTAGTPCLSFPPGKHGCAIAWAKEGEPGLHGGGRCRVGWPQAGYFCLGTLG